jgi:hypothetical protein
LKSRVTFRPRTAEDVARELHSLLTDALEARAAESGRPKDEALAIEVLRAFGAPGDVARRYGEPKYLIGPHWYPVFESVALGVLLVPLAVVVIAALIRMVVTSNLPAWPSALAGAWSFIQYAWLSFAVTVLVFAILERTVTNGSAAADADEEWDPRELPPLSHEGTERAVSRWESAFNVWGAIFWLTVLSLLPVGIFWGHQYRWWFLPAAQLGIPVPVTVIDIFLMGVVLLNVILWRQGRWSPATRWAQFALGLLAIAVLGLMLSTAGAPTIDAEWLRARGWDGEPAGPFDAAYKVNRIVRGVLGALLIWQLWNSARRLWRLLDHRRLTGSAAHPLTF